MRRLLSPSGLKVLKKFTGSKLLVAFDFDGTLAPIVPDPAKAVMRHHTRRLLHQVADRYPCVVISGRARADLIPRLDGAGLISVIGNHGIEPWGVSDALFDEVQRYGGRLTQALKALPGIKIENKGYSIAVHYRRSRPKSGVRDAIVAAASAVGDMRITSGKQVVNILPLGAPNKGIALAKERSRFGADKAIFVGDDDTDEDVFALNDGDRLLTVRVEKVDQSLADYYLDHQGDIDVLLRILLGHRS